MRTIFILLSFICAFRCDSFMSMALISENCINRDKSEEKGVTPTGTFKLKYKFLNKAGQLVYNSFKMLENCDTLLTWAGKIEAQSHSVKVNKKNRMYKGESDFVSRTWKASGVFELETIFKQFADFQKNSGFEIAIKRIQIDKVQRFIDVEIEMANGLSLTLLKALKLGYTGHKEYSFHDEGYLIAPDPYTHTFNFNNGFKQHSMIKDVQLII